VSRGTAISEPHQGIRVYDDAFAIEGQDGDWLLRADGPGQTVNEARFATLDEAIASALAWVAALPKHT
jgi:selenophosphate synthetase-related protein